MERAETVSALCGQQPSNHGKYPTSAHGDVFTRNLEGF